MVSMRKMEASRRVAFAAIALGFLAAPGMAAGPVTPRPDPEKGRALAERVCVACHVVSKQAASPVAADVPSFLAIANKPGQTMETVAGRIVIPHPPMPAIALSREEIANVVAYIMTLRDGEAGSP
jgi:cytochrome c